LRYILKSSVRKIPRVLYLSTYKRNYTRTDSLFELFNSIKLNYDFYIPKGWFRYISVIKFLICNGYKYDVIFVAFRGHEILPLIRLFTNKFIIFDAFISIYDTLCFDRKIFNPNSLFGSFLKWSDKFLCKISDFVLVDTKSHLNYFVREFSVPKEKIGYLYVGCNHDLFKFIKVKRDKYRYVVFWHGNVLPLQGVENIINVARILMKDDEIQFLLVGPIIRNFKNFFKSGVPNNIKFIDWVAYNKLPKMISMADLCLGGDFSNVPKASRVIPGKVFQYIACKRKVVLADNPANRVLFKPSDNIYYAPPTDIKKIAETIIMCKNG